MAEVYIPPKCMRGKDVQKITGLTSGQLATARKNGKLPYYDFNKGTGRRPSIRYGIDDVVYFMKKRGEDIEYDIVITTKHGNYQTDMVTCYNYEIHMGLDQYAYTRPDPDPGYQSHEEVAYWRKHNRLQGWMETLWVTKLEEKRKQREAMDEGDRFLEAIDTVEEEDQSTFNCVEIELDEHDLDSLENDIEDRNLPETSGFFFGNDSYEDYEGEYGYKNTDLEFIKNARKALKDGKRVYYNSSW
jgi:hypothetical protein